MPSQNYYSHNRDGNTMILDSDHYMKMFNGKVLTYPRQSGLSNFGLTMEVPVVTADFN